MNPQKGRQTELTNRLIEAAGTRAINFRSSEKYLISKRYGGHGKNMTSGFHRNAPVPTLMGHYVSYFMCPSCSFFFFKRRMQVAELLNC